MPWILMLHITAMLIWCGILLYLPVLIALLASGKDALDGELAGKLPRQLFTQALTPVALVAIVSGTLVFVIMNTQTVWLEVKLTLVCVLVICHALNGVLILNMERKAEKKLVFFALLLAGITFILITGIIWLVLAKPF